MEYPTSHLWQVEYFMVYHESALHNYLYHAIENTEVNTINATYAQRTMGRLSMIPSDVQRLSCILIGSIFYGMV
jgi:hypothetical protein